MSGRQDATDRTVGTADATTDHVMKLKETRERYASRKAEPEPDYEPRGGTCYCGHSDSVHGKRFEMNGPNGVATLRRCGRCQEACHWPGNGKCPECFGKGRVTELFGAIKPCPRGCAPTKSVNWNVEDLLTAKDAARCTICATELTPGEAACFVVCEKCWRLSCPKSRAEVAIASKPVFNTYLEELPPCDCGHGLASHQLLESGPYMACDVCAPRPCPYPVTEPKKPEGHTTRFSDSSLYDFVCTKCGANDGPSGGLDGPCTS